MARSSGPGGRQAACSAGRSQVVVRIPSADRFRSHYLKDLSEGGLFIRADRTFPTGSDLTIELWPPGGAAALTLSARITRVTEPASAQPGHPAGMAVTFISLTADAQERLRQLITEHGRPAVKPEPSENDPLGQVQRLAAELDETREYFLGAGRPRWPRRAARAEAYSDQMRQLESQEAEARAMAVQRAEACAALELENQKSAPSRRRMARARPATSEGSCRRRARRLPPASTSRPPRLQRLLRPVPGPSHRPRSSCPRRRAGHRRRLPPRPRSPTRSISRSTR